MKYTSALFLVLIIVPIAFAQSDVIELIEKSPEGKQVLDNIFLDVALEGRDIDVRRVRQRVNSIAKHTRAFRKAALAHSKVDAARCRAGLHAVKGRFNDFTQRAVYIRRQLAAARRNQQARGVLLQRASQALRHYMRFRDMIKNNGQAWRHFWNNAKSNYRRAAALISQVRAHVRRLHKNHRKAALIELPETYNTAMTEIAAQFDSTQDNLEGLRPVIQNLLEIVRKSGHLASKPSRVHVRRILRRLGHWLHARVHLFSEENHHQVGLYDELTHLFNDAMNRQSSLIKGLAREAKITAHKLQWMGESVKGAAWMASHAHEIVRLMKQECHTLNRTLKKVRHDSHRVLTMVGQVQEVIADRWNTLKSYFIERIEKLEEKVEN